MVGANCSIFGCSDSRRKSDIAIFKVPHGDDEWSSNWRKSIISVVIKDLVKKIFSSVEDQLQSVCAK